MSNSVKTYGEWLESNETLPQNTVLGYLYNEQFARRFAKWIEIDFCKKHEKEMAVFVDYIPEHSITKLRCWEIVIKTKDEDWEYIVQRLRPAFLALRYCTEPK